jgi:hypothetical protein
LTTKFLIDPLKNKWIILGTDFSRLIFQTIDQNPQITICGLFEHLQKSNIKSFAPHLFRSTDPPMNDYSFTRFGFNKSETIFPKPPHGLTQWRDSFLPNEKAEEFAIAPDSSYPDLPSVLSESQKQEYQTNLQKSLTFSKIPQKFIEGEFFLHQFVSKASEISQIKLSEPSEFTIDQAYIDDEEYTQFYCYATEKIQLPRYKEYFFFYLYHYKKFLTLSQMIKIIDLIYEDLLKETE